MAPRTLDDSVSAGELATSGACFSPGISDEIRLGRASGRIQHIRNGEVLSDETVYNVKTTAGIDFLFAQGYGTSAQANGLNYIGLSNDSVTETTASTTLTNEIAANGLTRAIGAYAHSAGASTATISKTFTCATGAQAAQKAALFSAGSSGTMTHVLAFTQRSLQIGDQLAITFTITLS